MHYRIHFIILFSLFSLLYSCQGIVDLNIEDENIIGNGSIDSNGTLYTTIMSVSDKSPQAQGGDCWGDFFFQFVTNNSIVRVYNLLTRKLIQTVSIPPDQQGFVANCHCNTVCFGSEYYDQNDEFPLIYVSTGYSSKGYTGALVYRITRKNDLFSLSLVQTIRFPVEKTSWTEFVTAGEYAYLCYTSERVIYKVPMPKLNEGDIIIDRGMALETYQFTPQPDWMSTSRNQDRLFYQGNIVYITGVPQAKEASAFVVLNLEKRERERIVDFIELGLRSESESLFVWKGNLCVAFLDQIVCLKL